MQDCNASTASLAAIRKPKAASDSGTGSATWDVGGDGGANGDGRGPILDPSSSSSRWKMWCGGALSFFFCVFSVFPEAELWVQLGRDLARTSTTCSSWTELEVQKSDLAVRSGRQLPNQPWRGGSSGLCTQPHLHRGFHKVSPPCPVSSGLLHQVLPISRFVVIMEKWKEWYKYCTAKNTSGPPFELDVHTRKYWGPRQTLHLRTKPSGLRHSRKNKHLAMVTSPSKSPSQLRVYESTRIKTSPSFLSSSFLSKGDK